METPLPLPPPIYVINLSTSINRKRCMEEQLSKLNLEFTFVDAVDGRKLDKLYIDKHYSSCETNKLHGRELTGGELGCSLSHISIYKRMIADGSDYAVVLEDDIYIGSSFREFIDLLPQLQSDGWEMINLISDTKSTSCGKPVFDIYRYSRFHDSSNRAAAYAIKLSAALKLLKYAYPIRFAADGLTGRFMETGVRLYGLSPDIVALRDVDSDIGPR